MIDLTLQQAVLRLCAIVFIAGVHGVAVAGVACALGDQGPRHDGRLSLNPLVHLDILGTVSGILFSIGWIKPVAIDPAELRFGRPALVVVVLAGLAATFLSAVVLRLARPALLTLLPDTASEITFAFIETIGQLSLWFVLVNALPVPSLTGGHIPTALMPRWRKAFVRSQPYAAIGMIILAATGLITDLLGGAYGTLVRLLPGG